MESCYGDNFYSQIEPMIWPHRDYSSRVYGELSHVPLDIGSGIGRVMMRGGSFRPRTSISSEIRIYFLRAQSGTEVNPTDYQSKHKVSTHSDSILNGQCEHYNCEGLSMCRFLPGFRYLP